MLVSSVVDRGFIGGVMVSVLVSSVVDVQCVSRCPVKMMSLVAVNKGWGLFSKQFVYDVNVHM